MIEQLLKLAARLESTLSCGTMVHREVADAICRIVAEMPPEEFHASEDF
jgi:hypothetical protein